MPIVASLSNAFYDKLGEQVVNELVDWLNAIDEEFRQQFRDRISLLAGPQRLDLERLRAEWRADIAASVAKLRADLGAPEDF